MTVMIGLGVISFLQIVTNIITPFIGKKDEAAAKKVEATAGKRLSAAPTALTRQSTRLASRKMTRNANLDDDDCYDLEGEV